MFYLHLLMKMTTSIYRKTERKTHSCKCTCVVHTVIISETETNVFVCFSLPVII